jgi:NAD-dependent SIR2 family protein deacetylase
MEIIEIPELPPQIKLAAELGELVIFIGAGMSYELGCSDWNGLANDLIRRCENTLGEVKCHYLSRQLFESLSSNL